MLAAEDDRKFVVRDECCHHAPNLAHQIAHVVAMDAVVQYAPIYSLNERGWRMHAMPQINLGNITIAAGGTLAEFSGASDESASKAGW